MIKSFENKNLEELDKAVNEFLTKKKLNGPVRTDAYVLGTNPAIVMHRAVVFYNADFSGSIQEEETQTHEDDIKPSRTKIGSLWNQDTGFISGYFRDEKFVIPASEAETLKSKGLVKCKIKGQDVQIEKNLFKKKPTHPDYLIFI